MMNATRRHPTRGEVVSWIKDTWNNITASCIKNTWGYIGHFVPGEFGDPTTTQSDDVASTPMIVGIGHDDDGWEESRDKGEGVECQEEETRENDPLFHRGHHLWSNLLDTEDEEPLFVM
jgi:hypothetical protein